MKHHAGAIFVGGKGLSWAQRYQFLSGWLPWISDGLGMIVTLLALVWTMLMTIAPRYFDVPMSALSAAALALFIAKTMKTLLLYPQKVRSGVLGALMASVAGLSLTHTVSKAVIAGLFTSKKPFLRTPKCEDRAHFNQAFRLIWQETTLLGLCLLALFVMAVFNNGFQDPAATLWMVMLTIQSLPYAATVATAAISAMASAKASNVRMFPMPAPQPPTPNEPALSKAA